MFEFDPDNTQNALMESSTLSFVLPPNKGAYLSAEYSGAWEQCAVVFVGQTRQEKQLGNIGRGDSFLIIDNQPHEQTITVVGWHKRGHPPQRRVRWTASRGLIKGEVLCWDDSSNDEDYNDIRIKLTIG